MKKYLVFGGIIIIALLFFLFRSSPEEGQIAPSQSDDNVPAGQNEPAATTGNTIKITSDGFVPAELPIIKGETVTFINESDNDAWPASGIHPTHDLYPEKGGCINTTFDACRALKNGESWDFTFKYAGTWKYHDHLAPSARGTIVVTEGE